MAKLRKIEVSTGIFWVEVPEVNLYILCGTPADSVKHLMKRGLNVFVEEKGALFETGPNAILLSDILLQNGQISNLAEFPVLQMLYRQGMLLPEHPNNTDQKPLLIGSHQQVEAQMRYIYRGNYGLISEQEICDTGIESETAKEMMRMKLSFAFGKICPSRDLLSTLIVKEHPVEIRNGVTIARTGLNQFRFHYEQESVDVNLNLKPRQPYETPYPLGFSMAWREYFSVIHCGDGDGWDVNRPCMSSVLMFQGKVYLIDAGPNLHNILIALGIGISEIEGIFHTHCHDDHFAGLTALIRADHRIKYYATPLVRSAVQKKLSALLAMEERDFFHYFDVHDLEFNQWNNVEALEVNPIFSPHPVETSILLFRTIWKNGYRSYGHFADIVALNVLEKMITDDPKAPGVSQAFYDQIKQNYLIPTDLKKLDIGGGLIHGKAEDFREDRSRKIILSHTASVLSAEEKEIGSEATFGSVDVLIHTNQNYVLRYAYEFLTSYFPEAPQHQKRILLNNDLVTFNPGTIILKEQETCDRIYLLLTGNAEWIDTRNGIDTLLSAGALIGELNALNQHPSVGTYRAVSYLQALEIPTHIYIEFIKNNNLMNSVRQLQANRTFLQSTCIFGSALSYITQNRLAQAMEEVIIDKKEKIESDLSGTLYVLAEGEVERYLNDRVYETLVTGDFFGEEMVLFNVPGIFEMRTTKKSRMFRFPGKMVREIPIVRWKLLEAFEKRRRYIFQEARINKQFFYWRDEYAIRIQIIDQQHERMFVLASRIIEMMKQSHIDLVTLEETIDLLAKFTQEHFLYEEKLLKKHQFPHFDQHREHHQLLASRFLEIKADILSHVSSGRRAEQFSKFFISWIVDHILTEDQKYASFLREKGVY
ncbi:bacteriohemerythrin [Magnetococcales bacterium HHB-1]